MEQVGSSASKDRYQLSTTSGASTGGAGEARTAVNGPVAIASGRSGGPS